MRAVRADRILSQLGRRIAELRDSATMTQEALAERMGVSTRYVQRVEAGSENVTVVTLVNFANGLRVPLPELFVVPVRPRAKPGRPRANPPR